MHPLAEKEIQWKQKLFYFEFGEVIEGNYVCKKFFTKPEDAVEVLELLRELIEKQEE